MKATKLTIRFREWSKLADFAETINEEDEMVAYQIDNTTAAAQSVTIKNTLSHTEFATTI